MNILFVCTGNTCRSCMAEAIFNKLCDKEGMTSFSAGLCAIPQSRASVNSVEILNKYMNIDITGRNAVQITEELFQKSDLILTMSQSIKKALIHTFEDSENKVFSLNEYVGAQGEILDPYGENISVYEETFHMLEELVILLIAKLKGDSSIV